MIGRLCFALIVFALVMGEQFFIATQFENDKFIDLWVLTMATFTLSYAVLAMYLMIDQNLL